MKIKILGTGNGLVTDLYNTCFAIQNEQGTFLVDSGGSSEIIKRLQQANIKLTDLKNIFISHSHMDHILGLIWLFKKIGVMAKEGEITEKINVYCNDEVYDAIKGISNYVLSAKLVKVLWDTINFIILENLDRYTINGVDYEFFDIQARGVKQFGFMAMLEGNKFIFLGDETLNPVLYDKVKEADYVMHEAFCLDSEEDIFHAYEKNHSTALSASKVMESLKVSNLILYHTCENHGLERKEMYEEEARSVFSGNVIVPDEMEDILILKKK